MKQEIQERHDSTADGMPAGGETKGIGLDIRWQNGPLGRGEGRVKPNGAFGRLNYYQNTRFKCRENALAITKLEEALHWLQARTNRREAENVEGTHQGN
jgi:hypothetical protein